MELRILKQQVPPATANTGPYMINEPILQYKEDGDWKDIPIEVEWVKHSGFFIKPKEKKLNYYILPDHTFKPFQSIEDGDWARPQTFIKEIK